MARQFTLGKKERLKSRKAIEQLFSEGKKMMVAPFRIFYILRSSVAEPALLFGAGVSSRNFKKAVDRNRIKRLTREAYRLQKKSLGGKVAEKKVQLDVFFIYTGKELPAWDEVYKKAGIALSKLEKIVSE